MTVQYRLVTDNLLCAIAEEIHYVDRTKLDEGYWCHGDYHHYKPRITQAEMVLIMEDKLEGPILLKTLKHRKHRSNEIIDIKKRRFSRGQQGPPGKTGTPGDKGLRGDTGMIGCTGTPGKPAPEIKPSLWILSLVAASILSALISTFALAWLYNLPLTT